MKKILLLTILLPYFLFSQTSVDKVYDFDIGDEFHYRSEYGSAVNGYLVTKTIKKIIGKSYSSGFVTYTIHSYGREQLPNPSPPTIFSNVISERYDTSLIFADTIPPCFGCLKRTDSVYTDLNFGLTYSNDTARFEYFGTEKYSQYLGRTSKSEQWSDGGNPDRISEELVYFKKESLNITWGIPYTFTSSIKEYNLTNFSFYPNPATNFITVDYNDNSSSHKYQLINSLGQVLLSGKNEQANIDVSAIPSGIYFLKIINEDGDSGVKRVVVSR